MALETGTRVGVYEVTGKCRIPLLWRNVNGFKSHTA